MVVSSGFLHQKTVCHDITEILLKVALNTTFKCLDYYWDVVSIFTGIGFGLASIPYIIAILSGVHVALKLCVCGAIMCLMPLLSCLPLRNVVFHGMCIANLFWSFGSTIIYLYLPSYAMDFGTDFGTAVNLISCIGMLAFTAWMVFAFMGNNSALDNMTSLLCSVGLAGVDLRKKINWPYGPVNFLNNWPLQNFTGPRNIGPERGPI